MSTFSAAWAASLDQIYDEIADHVALYRAPGGQPAEGVQVRLIEKVEHGVADAGQGFGRMRVDRRAATAPDMDFTAGGVQPVAGGTLTLADDTVLTIGPDAPMLDASAGEWTLVLRG